MHKKLITVILVTVLVLSLSIGVVTAKKPDNPPGKPVEEVDTFTVFIGPGDVTLIETIPPYPSSSNSFDVITDVGDWDYIDGVEGGDPRESYRWTYWDGAYGEPMITYGIFEFSKVFIIDGLDLRPEQINEDPAVYLGEAHMLAVGHGVNPDRGMDWCYTVLEWELELTPGEFVTVNFGARSLLDSEPECTPDPNDGSPVTSWAWTLYTNGDQNDLDRNTEFSLQYWWYTIEDAQQGKSGRTKEVYHSVTIWGYDGGPQPDRPVSISTTVIRSP